MTPDRFIMTEKDREEWKDGLEHADARKLTIEEHIELGKRFKALGKEIMQLKEYVANHYGNSLVGNDLVTANKKIIRAKDALTLTIGREYPELCICEEDYELLPDCVVCNCYHKETTDATECLRKYRAEHENICEKHEPQSYPILSKDRMIKMIEIMTSMKNPSTSPLGEKKNDRK